MVLWCGHRQRLADSDRLMNESRASTTVRCFQNRDYISMPLARVIAQGVRPDQAVLEMNVKVSARRELWKFASVRFDQLQRDNVDGLQRNRANGQMEQIGHEVSCALLRGEDRATHYMAFAQFGERKCSFEQATPLNRHRRNCLVSHKREKVTQFLQVTNV